MRTLFTALFWMLVTVFALAQPGNDDCASATTIVVGGGCITGDNTSATTEGLANPSCWNGPPSNYSATVWYSFTATDDSITINTGDGTLGTNTLTVVYSGTCGALTEIGCSKSAAEIDLTGLDDVTPQTYYIMIDGSGTNEGTFCVSAYETPPPPPPIGTCENPRDFQVATDCNNISGTQYGGQNNIISTDLASGGDAGADATGYGNPEGLENICGGVAATDDAYWVRFTATGTSHTFHNAGGDALDYTVYSGIDCSSLTEQSCATISGGASGSISGFTAGQEYYVMITNSAGSSTTQRYLCITGTAYTNPYDNCNNALSITDGVIYDLNNANSSDDGGVGDLCAGSVENSVWMAWTTPATWTGDAFVHLYNQDCACENGLQMAIHTSSTSCPGNSPTCEVSLNPNNNNDFYGQFTPSPGSTYYIAIDGYAECACDFDFAISGTNIPPVLATGAHSLMAAAQDKHNMIRWKPIEKESVVEIQRSASSTGFTTIGEVNIHNTQLGEYATFNDRQPLKGKNYYRLKVNTEDGFHFSHIVSVNRTDHREVIESVLPNYLSAGQQERLMVSFSDHDDMMMSLMTVSGATVQQWYVPSGNTMLHIDVSALNSGMYFLMAGQGVQRSIKKINVY